MKRLRSRLPSTGRMSVTMDAAYAKRSACAAHNVRSIVAVVRLSETIVVLFAVYLAITAWIRVPARRAAIISVLAGVLCGLVLAVARVDVPTVRNWAPALYIVAAYFLTGLTFVSPMPGIEAWLSAWDRR